MPYQKILLLFINILIFTTQNGATQQLITPKVYPKGKFRNPVNIPLSLAGNFGECRPNHFHSGLDVRTNKVENIPIYAIADGYVSRIKIEAGGFGNAIYVTHKGGYTSLYAHLNEFYTELEQYVRAKQYEQKSWKIDFTLQPHQFPVSKGHFLAKSGNTGSSQAPHLHMEIRDSKTDKPLNGLLFYNAIDTKAPLLKNLAIYDCNKSIYDQKPMLQPCIKSGANYKLKNDTITVSSNNIGLGVVADDPMENCLGVLGVFETDIYINDAPHFAWQLDNIGYEETRYMNAMADYKTKKNGGQWIQLCYKLPGNYLEIYKGFNKSNDGRIVFNDNTAKKIKLVSYDVNGNKTELNFWIKSTLQNTNKLNYDLLASKLNTIETSDISFTLPNKFLYDDVANKVNASQVGGNFVYNVLQNDIPVHDYFELKLKPHFTVNASDQNKIAIVRLPYGKDKDKKGKAAKMLGNWAIAQVKEFGSYQVVLDKNAPTISGGPAAIVKSPRIIFFSKDDITSVAKFEATLNGKWIRLQQKGNSYIYEVDKFCNKGSNELNVTSVDENGNSARKQFYFQY
jgi:hypothetical protein